MVVELVVSPERQGPAARQKLENAARVESATRRPTYYYLMRYFGLRRGEAKRPCPSCGGRWARRGERHAFRCGPCRLVSTVGPSLDRPPPSP